MALFEPGGIVPEDEGFAGLGFGDEDFERQVDCAAGSRDHKRRSGCGVAEEEQLGGAHGEAGRGGFAGVIDEAEELDAFFLQQRLQPRDGFVDGIVAGYGIEAFMHDDLLTIETYVVPRTKLATAMATVWQRFRRPATRPREHAFFTGRQARLVRRLQQ